MKKFQQILKNSEVKGKGVYYNYSCFGEPWGKYDIKENDYDEFINIYSELIENSKYNFHFVEKPKEISNLLFDIDFNYEGLKRKYKIGHISMTVNNINSILTEYFKLSKSKLKAYIFEKKKPTQKTNNNNCKDGFHIIYPKIQLETKYRYFIRDELIKKINKSKIYDNLNLSNDINDVIDEAIIFNNGWFLYGSSKPNRQPYKLTYILDNDLDECNIIKLKIKKLPLLLSNRKKIKSKIKLNDDVDKNKLNIKLEKYNKTKNKKINTNLSSNHKYSDYKNIIEKFIKCLNVERSKNYNDWIKICWIIKNLSLQYNFNGFKIFDDFSKLSPSVYDINSVKNIYIRSDGERDINIGSLIDLAKQDNIEEAKKIQKEFILFEKNKNNKNDEINSNDDDTSFIKLRNKLLNNAKKNKYRRIDEYIYKPKKNNPIVYEIKCTIKEYINEIFNNDMNCEEFNIYHSSENNNAKLIKYLKDMDHPYFPFMKYNDRIIAFKNGYLKLDKEKKENNDDDDEIEEDDKIEIDLTFHKYTNNEKFCVRKYLKYNFDEKILKKEYNEIETPYWDKLIKHHIEDNKIYEIFNCFMGRLLYPTGTDDWQCFPFLLGQGNTGKSTIFDIINSFFGSGEIGTIESNHEATFGLEKFLEKNLIICSDIPQNMKKIFNKSTFQKMISGESVSVARKGLKAIDILKWKVPIFFGGNYYPDYDDSSNSFSRRIAIFNINKEIKNKDTTLVKKIKKQELLLLLIKILKSYQYHKIYFSTKAFEDWNIDYFINNKKDLNEQNNHIERFLNLPLDERKTKYKQYKLYYKKNAKTRYNIFKKGFMYWLKNKEKNNIKLSKFEIISALKKAKYEIKGIMTCKACGNPHKTDCCNNYDRLNRTRVEVINNMAWEEINLNNNSYQFNDIDSM